MIDNLQSLALDRLQLSATGSQAERRKHFDKDAIASLAESIKSVGLLQPIVARPVNGHFEIVAGERRFMAAKKAGLAKISVSVRDLTDEQVLEVQLIENLQREGLHELAEAEGYEALMKAHRYSVEQLVEKLSKSRAYVYGRLKLLALCKDARSAFYAGKISASVALLIARIPGEKLQKDALKDVADRHDPMSARAASDHIQRRYMLRLSDASFPTNDETLCKGSVACGRCPKRTGAQPELFGDVKGADVCTDPPCFAAKTKAWTERAIEKAQANGQQVITGAKAKAIAPYGAHSLQGGYVNLDDHCWEDPKNRTYKQLLGKNAQPALLEIHEGQDIELVEVVRKEDVAAQLRSAGIKPSISARSSSDVAAERKKKLETTVRTETFTAIRAKYPKKLDRPVLAVIAGRLFDRLENETKKKLLGLLEWELKETKRYGNQVSPDPEATAKERIPKMSEAELIAFILDCCMASDLSVWTYGIDNESPPILTAMAKRTKVDAAGIRRRVKAAAAAKLKAAGKKSAAKSKGKK